MRAEHLLDDSSQPSQASEGRSHPKGSVLAPMAGLVVKVLLKDGVHVEDGQPVMVIEAMKMEVRMNLLTMFCKLLIKLVNADITLLYSFYQHVVKAPRAGYIEGLKATAGQQVFDSSVLFTVKVCINN